MKKLLITGFEPFGGETVNPSWEAVTKLPDSIGEYSLTKLLLPVVFGEATDVALRLADDLHPDVILCIGQAGGRNAITPELVGINLCHATIPDNKGNQPIDEPAIVGGQTAYFSTLPVRAIAEAIRGAGIPSQVSYSAGAYVCNELLYTLLAQYSDGRTGNENSIEGNENGGTRVGFIHIPFCEEQGKQPSMPLATIVKGLTVAIENL